MILRGSSSAVSLTRVQTGRRLIKSDDAMSAWVLIERRGLVFDLCLPDRLGYLP